MKVVYRLLAADGRLLGWQAIDGVLRGDGRLWSDGPVVVPVDVGDSVAAVSVHWADAHIETRHVLPTALTVRAGASVTVADGAVPIFELGRPPTDALPPISTRQSVAVLVPVGRVGAGS